VNREQYKPTELIDFSNENNVESMQNALESVKEKLGQTYSLRIGGQDITTDNTFTSSGSSKSLPVLR